jgi:hypothetical protein
MRRFLLVCLLAGCVDRAPGNPAEKVDETRIREAILDEVPADIGRRVAARFTTGDGGIVDYLGVTVEGEGPAAPGGDVTLVHYWQVVAPPGPGWRIFTHVAGGVGDFVNATDSELRHDHPPSRWEAGQILRDEQTFALDADWKSVFASVEVGLYPLCCRGVEDRAVATVDGAAVEDGAVEVARLKVDTTKAPPPVAGVVLRKASSPITIDGNADETAWRRAAHNEAFDDVEGCAENEDATEARITWDDQFLYVWVSTDDTDVHSPYTERDDPLYSKADVIEVFIDADGNRKGYVELQVNPRNTQFDTYLVKGKGDRRDAYDSKMQTAVAVKGTLDNRDDGDSGWAVEMAIPHAAVKGEDPDMKVEVPPRVGDTWRLNIVRVDYRKDGSTAAHSWARIACADFHGIDKLVAVQFADASGSVEPKKATTPEPATPEPGKPEPAPPPKTPETPARPEQKPATPPELR